ACRPGSWRSAGSERSRSCSRAACSAAAWLEPGRGRLRRRLFRLRRLRRRLRRTLRRRALGRLLIATRLLPALELLLLLARGLSAVRLEVAVLPGGVWAAGVRCVGAVGHP